MPTCEWNPRDNRAAREEDGCPNDAVLNLGTDALGWHIWHLCESCAALPRFDRYDRKPLTPPRPTTSAGQFPDLGGPE